MQIRFVVGRPLTLHPFASEHIKFYRFILPMCSCVANIAFGSVLCKVGNVSTLTRCMISLFLSITVLPHPLYHIKTSIQFSQHTHTQHALSLPHTHTKLKKKGVQRFNKNFSAPVIYLNIIYRLQQKTIFSKYHQC